MWDSRHQLFDGAKLRANSGSKPFTAEGAEDSRRARRKPGQLALSQAVFAFDLILGEATDSGQRTSAVGYSNRDHDFIGARRIV